MDFSKTNLIIVFCCISIWGFSQTNQYNPHKGTNYPDAKLQAFISAENSSVNKANFKYYMNLAYQKFKEKNYCLFITYTNQALQTGLYNASLYYFRGISYEMIGDQEDAKESYKRSYNLGMNEAKDALYRLRKNR
jgi:tetratricopeptide (TPR) repeat protein